MEIFKIIQHIAVDAANASSCGYGLGDYMLKRKFSDE